MTDSKHTQITQKLAIGVEKDKPEILFEALALTLLEIEARLTDISNEIAGRGKW